MCAALLESIKKRFGLDASLPTARRLVRGQKRLALRLMVEALEDRRLVSTFTVTNTNDSGPGSLRQAILDANDSPGLDTIGFSIGSGVQTIRTISELPTITDPVIIDGTTQPGFAGTPIIELNGANAGIFANGLTVSGGNSTIRGLVINGFHFEGITLSSNSNVVEGCYVGTDVTGRLALNNLDGISILSGSNNRIGGTTAAAQNVISGNLADGILVWGFGASGNIIQGNYIGTNAAGDAPLPNFTGVDIFAQSNNLIGGTQPGAGNVISGNGFSGIDISFAESTGNVVQGNFIGTNATVTAAVPNGSGVDITSDASNNTIGGTDSGAGNVISGNTFEGIELVFGANRNLVQGNFIGTDSAGALDLGNGFSGVNFVDASNNLIGGTAAGAGNVIAQNGFFGGVSVESGNGDGILGNSIFANRGPGIHLSPGANNDQRFPELTSAVSDGVTTTVQGTLTSTPSTTFRLEFFGNPVCDPSGYGQGQTFPGWSDVTTDGSGVRSFTAFLPSGVPPGQFVTATATDPGNNSSEFSACQVVVGGPSLPNREGTGRISTPEQIAATEMLFQRFSANRLGVSPFPGNEEVLLDRSPCGPRNQAVEELSATSRPLKGHNEAGLSSRLALHRGPRTDLCFAALDGRSKACTDFPGTAETK